VLTRGNEEVIDLADSLALDMRNLRRLIRITNDTAESRHIITRKVILDFVKWGRSDVFKSVRREGADTAEIGIGDAVGRLGNGEALREDLCTEVDVRGGGRSCAGLCVRGVGVRVVNPEDRPF